MGQKINATGLRLKKRLNWNSVFYTHNSKNGNYQNLVQTVQQKKVITKYLLYKLGYYTNNLFITKNSKTFQISGKTMQYNNDQSTTKNANINNAKQKLIYHFSDINNSKDFTIISPKLITTHIRTLLGATGKKKTDIVPTNLNVGIATFVTRFIKPFKDNLLGIKVICSGKWKKTKSGRKQKLCIKFGNIKKTTVSSSILFDYTSKKTKYGVCGIKVWVAVKKCIDNVN